jgi:hypothetical protein
MSNVVPFKGKSLVCAVDLSDRHMGRVVRIGDIEGSLVGLIPSRSRVDVVLIVGGGRAIFPLALDAAVEVGPKHIKEPR